MIKIQIQSISGSLLFEHESENNTIKETVEKAISERVDLQSADLRSADLRYANLESADLRSADLRYANLQSADIRSANLQYADIGYANLQSAYIRYADIGYANLRSANLESADLRYADLRSADLRYANLQSADIGYANLQYADIRSAKNWQHTEWANQAKPNILFILSHLKSEVPGLRQALIDGKINGIQYEGECCCLIGTIGKEKGIEETCNTIPFYVKGLHNLAEQFFYQIKEGDTPENSEFSRVAVELCDMILNS